MSEPIVIIIGTTPAIALAVACMVLVTVLAVLDYRRRGRVMRRLLTEAEAGRDCVQVSEDWARHVRREGPTRHGSFSYQDGPIPPGTMTSRELAETEDD